MKTILITGCGGLVGMEATEYFLNKGYVVVGIDNNQRKYFFGDDGSVDENLHSLQENTNFHYYDVDIREFNELDKIFNKYSTDIESIIHTAAQPSHDWAVKEVFTDFHINATSTINLLELYRTYCSNAVFIFTSTNKVYGDNPNYLDFIETDTRFELEDTHTYYNGIDETFSIDNTMHSLFGCSKTSADMYVQEYGKYFGLNTVVFRGGCLTGNRHRGAELHGFLNYLVKCNLEGRTYNLFGYKGKQVRDNIHSSDLIRAFDEVILKPTQGQVYNIGGSRHSNCSILEATEIIENITSKKMNLNYVSENRKGDHIWWISDVSKFKRDYPNWDYQYNIHDIITDIINNL